MKSNASAAPAEGALFPPIEPFATGMLDVGDGHQVYFEQCGNPAGLPVLFFHGGPASGCSPQHRRLFDPARLRVILFDQRGCGRSTPRGEMRHNTAQHLLADAERLRAHLGIERWLVYGGSWGSSLALAYCAQYKTACLGAIMRGIFLTGRGDIEWFFDGGQQVAPDVWHQLAALAPRRRRKHLLDWYIDTIAGEDRALALEAIRRWMRWEEALAAPMKCPPLSPMPEGDDAQRLLDKYRLQGRYLKHQCYLGEAHLLDCAARMHGVPTAILHGRLDMVCRPQGAWRVHETLHGSRLELVEGTGHSPFDPPMARALIAATAHFIEHGHFEAWGMSVHAS